MKAKVINSTSVNTDMAAAKLKLITKKKKSTSKTLIILSTLVVCLSLWTFYYSQSDYFGLFGPKMVIPLTLPEIEVLFQKVYPKRSGYHLDDEEKKNIALSGGESSYGEILYNTTYKLLFDIFQVDENSVVHDFGSGVGKFAIQTRLTSNVSKVIATEMSATRSVIARGSLQKVKDLGILAQNDSKIVIIEGDFLKLDISDATHIYMCSTCFHEELMNNIYKKIVKEGKHGLQVVSLVSFTIPKKDKKNPRRLVYQTTHTVPMSWSNTSPGYHYILEDATANVETLD